MAYDTKVALQAVLNVVLLSKDKEQIYKMVAKMAKVEGMSVPSYKEAMAEIENDDKE